MLVVIGSWSSTSAAGRRTATSIAPSTTHTALADDGFSELTLVCPIPLELVVGWERDCLALSPPSSVRPTVTT